MMIAIVVVVVKQPHVKLNLTAPPRLVKPWITTTAAATTEVVWLRSEVIVLCAVTFLVISYFTG